MSSDLAGRLSAARRRQFIGRADELERFQYAIAAPELPFHVLHVFGPGGVGKTSLLQEFARVCEQTETSAVYLDARNLNLTDLFVFREKDQNPAASADDLVFIMDTNNWLIKVSPVMKVLPSVSALFIALIGLAIMTQALIQIGLVRL